MAKIQIDLFDAEDGTICVYFSRQGGASMLFYDQFNKLKEAIANMSNQWVIIQDIYWRTLDETNTHKGGQKRKW